MDYHTRAQDLVVLYNKHVLSTKLLTDYQSTITAVASNLQN